MLRNIEWLISGVAKNILTSYRQGRAIPYNNVYCKSFMGNSYIFYNILTKRNHHNIRLDVLL